jgi:class 3 adenylate cyclase/tetratricopeptide (TPR) repeat protein
MDVVVWLRSLGLGKYEAAFRDNEIDETVLPGLTHENLKELGVAALGHRLKLLDAIAALRSDAGVKPSPADAATASDEPSTSPEDRAERRQVTVMFSDLVGSTALSGRMDPEDLREVISAYQKSVAETVGRFGGFVAKYMGDGVLIYFGYPHAHEDDAERAVRAGLELVAAVSDLKTHAALQTRVGIATGLVVVGDLIGSGASQEQAIVGETPNLAARLQGIAEPNNVVIAESTRKLVGNLFELEDLGAQDLKGIAGPVRAWAALRGASVEGRFDAFHASGLTDLIGREEELELLLRRWLKAKTGEGQVVLLSGEAGIGKSRLTAALLERLAGEPHTRLRYFCSPQHTDSALYPIISQMERAAGFAHGDTAQTKLDKLDALLAQSFTPRQDAALFTEMLSLPNDGRYPILELSPQQRRQRTLEALTAQIEALSRSKPVLMIFEDVHWIDPTSLEALGRTVDLLRTLAVLLIVTYRPEFEPPWIGRPHVTPLTVNRLGEREIAAMIDGVIGNKPLPANVRQDIVERTDGIPLFVEEMTKAVLEAESEGDARKTTAAVPSSAQAVPASLHASLMARLDRLGAAKEMAQIGAVIGREFSHALLAAVAGKVEAELQPALHRLMAAGLLFRQGVPPHATYLFKHALVQDAAYGTLLREPRRALHSRIVEILESKFPEIAEGQPELLARHSTEAGLIEKAAGLWGKAGQRSLARSALVEGIEQVTRALSQIGRLPATPALRGEQINLQVALIAPLYHVKGAAAPETKAAADRARLLIEEAQSLGEAPDDPLLLFSVLYGFWVLNLVAFNGPLVSDLATQFLTLAEKQRATVPLMVGHRLMSVSLTHLGKFAEARAHSEHALRLYDPVEHRPLAMRFGQDVRVAILSYNSWASWFLGYPEAALGATEQAIKDAREIGHAATALYALAHASMVHSFCGDYSTAYAEAGEDVALASEKGSPFWAAFGKTAQGCLCAAIGKPPDEAVQMISSGLDALRSTGTAMWQPYHLACLAKAYAVVGNFDNAWRCLPRL